MTISNHEKVRQARVAVDGLQDVVNKITYHLRENHHSNKTLEAALAVSEAVQQLKLCLIREDMLLGQNPKAGT